MNNERSFCKGIKYETAKRIISSALSSDSVTRTELAGSANVSAVTAGKAITALVDNGILSADDNNPPRFSKTDKLKVLLLKLGREKYHYTLQTLSGKEISIGNAERSHNTLYAEDANKFITTTFDKLRAICKGSACVCEIILDTDEQLDISATGSPSIIIDSKESTINAVSSLADGIGETALYIEIGEYTDYRLIVNGTPTPQAPSGYRIVTPKEETELICEISNRILSLAHVTLPSRIFINSEKMRIDAKLIAALRQSLESRTVSLLCSIDELRGSSDREFEREWAQMKATERYAELLAGTVRDE